MEFLSKLHLRGGYFADRNLGCPAGVRFSRNAASLVKNVECRHGALFRGFTKAEAVLQTFTAKLFDQNRSKVMSRRGNTTDS